MDWTRILAYITGSVDQELLLRNEYLAAEKILRAQLNGCCGSRAPSERYSVRLAFDWAARPWAKWRPSPSQTPFWHGTEGSSLANSRDREHGESGGARGSTEKS